MTQDWLGLAIGNSRLHWAWFDGEVLRLTWDTEHFDAATIQRLILSQFNFNAPDLLPKPIALPCWQTPLPLWIASVVPQQTHFWQQYPQARSVNLEDIPLNLQQQPLHQTYPTLGVDRALALWGAIQVYGSPVLVIDGGTALTLTGADKPQNAEEPQNFVGGAIFPGVRSLFQTLKHSTAALPLLERPECSFDRRPDRWATNTQTAIQSGVLYMLVAGLKSFIQDWLQRYPDSPVILTGGDALLIKAWINVHAPAMAVQIQIDPQLIFSGVRAVVRPHYRAAQEN